MQAAAARQGHYGQVLTPRLFIWWDASGRGDFQAERVYRFRGIRRRRRQLPFDRGGNDSQTTIGLPWQSWRPVDTENPVRIENAGIRSVREIIIVSMMTPFFIALLALVTSTFRTRAA